MTTAIPDITWNLTGPWDTKHPGTLEDRLTEAVDIYIHRFGYRPTIALVSGGDWQEAASLTTEGKRKFPATVNGKKVLIELRPSPFAGNGRDIYMGREVMT